MSNITDFIIENGVLTKYVGKGVNVVVPEGVTSIGDRSERHSRPPITPKLRSAFPTVRVRSNI